MEIIGILKVKGEAVQVSDKFRKREFVITDNSTQYPQHISIQLTQDKCDMLDKFHVGNEIKVHINLRGREWTSPKNEVKYFNTIEAWRIELVASDGTITEQPAESFVPNTQEDDLPF